MALSVVDLYAKILPKTNCKDCGFPTCLAFAGMVVSRKHPLENCPHIAPEVLKAAGAELEAQYRQGKWLQKDMASEALELARQKTASMALEDISLRIGGELTTIDGEKAIVLPCFNTKLHITSEKITDDSGKSLPKNNQTFVYIHMAHGGFKKPTGNLKGFKEFPNTVSKIVSMKDHVEAPLKKMFTKRMNALKAACIKINGQDVTSAFDSASFACRFQAFPKVPVVLLFWDAEDDFEADVKLLFDETVIEHLDIEAIMFLSEHLVKLLES